MSIKIQVYDFTSKRTGKTEKRYRAFYRDADGALQAKVFPKRADAEWWRKEGEAEALTGAGTNRKAGRQTFKALWDEVHAATEYAPATLAVHEYVWAHVESLADKRLSEINAATIKRVLDRIKKPSMREKSRFVISSLFNHAIAEGRVKVNPAVKHSAPKTRTARKREKKNTAKDDLRRLNMDQLALLVADLPERYRAAVRLMAYIGLRPGECYALKVGKVDLLHRTLRIDTAASGDTKTGEARTLPLAQIEADMLTSHLAKFSDPRNPEALVFQNPSGEMIDGQSFRRLFQRAAKRVGIPDGEHLHVNDLRHTCAAFNVAQGVDVVALSNLLGHAKPSITLDIYSRLWDGSLEKLAEQRDAAIRETWDDAPPEAGVVEFKR